MDGTHSALTRPPTSSSSLFSQTKQPQNSQQPQQQQQRTFDIPALSTGRSLSPGVGASSLDRTSKREGSSSTLKAAYEAEPKMAQGRRTSEEKAKAPIAPLYDARDDMIKDLQSDLDKLKRNCTCVVCQDLLFEPYSLGCGHVFCYTCLNDWLKQKKTCPECRAKVKIQPAPAYLVRDMIETFVMRAELQSPHEEGQELRGLQSDALKSVKRDQESSQGLFNGIFKTRKRKRAVMDDGDRVVRCPDCLWEIEDGSCTHCGRRFRASDMPGGSDLDSDDDSEDVSGSETSESEDDSDEDHPMEDDELSHISVESDETVDPIEFRRHFFRSLSELGDHDFGPGGVEVAQEAAWRTMEHHVRQLRAGGHRVTNVRRTRTIEGEWDDEVSDDYDDEDEEEEEDEDASDLDSFIEHDTSPAVQRTGHSGRFVRGSVSPPYSARNRTRSMTPQAYDASFEPSPSPQRAPNRARGNRRPIVPDDEDEDDDDEENSSVSDFVSSRNAAGARRRYEGRTHIVISSDNEEEAEGLMADMHGYAQLDHDTTCDDDDDDDGVSDDLAIVRSSSEPPARSNSAPGSRSFSAEEPGRPFEPVTRRRRHSVRFSVPEDADEEDYESDLSRDVEGDLDMDRHSSEGPQTTTQRSATGRGTRFQEDATTHVEGGESSDDSLPIQRSRRRIGSANSASTLRGTTRAGSSSSRRGNTAGGNSRTRSRQVIDPNVRRLLGNFNRRRAEQEFDQLGRSTNGDGGNASDANSSARGGPASRDLRELSEPIVITSSPAISRTPSTIPPIPGANTRVAEEPYSPTSPLTARISRLDSGPNPYEIDYASSGTYANERDSFQSSALGSPAPSSSGQFSPLVEHGASSASNFNNRQPQPPPVQNNHNSASRMRRRSNTALREQQSRNRLHPPPSTASPATSFSRAATIPANTTLTAEETERRRRGREMVLARQRIIAEGGSTAANRAAAARTSGSSSAQRQHDLSLQQRFVDRRTNSASSVGTRDSATPTPVDAVSRPAPPRRAETAEPVSGSGRRRLAAQVGTGARGGGPLLVIGDEDDL